MSTITIDVGKLYVATVKLRPVTLIAHPELTPFDGQRSTFAACWLFERECSLHRGEIAMIHRDWPIRWVASGDVVDAVLSDEDPFDE